MGKVTTIPWCDHTFNPWRGCRKISPGCEHCYAERLARRNVHLLGTWGRNGRRVIAAESTWKQPLRWNRAAAKAGVRRSVLCGSMCDVFEDGPVENRAEMTKARLRLWQLIRDTPSLDWMLLTKRIESPAIEELWAPSRSRGPGLFTDHQPPPNVWLGVSVEDQPTADMRIEALLKVPAAAHFVSIEPLLDRIVLESWWLEECCPNCGGSDLDCDCDLHGEWPIQEATLDGVFVGGETGPRARPCQVEWIEDIIRDCHDARPKVPCFVKQFGTLAIWKDRALNLQRAKGDDPNEWPEHLRVRELPQLDG